MNHSPIILALETATSSCSAALNYDNQIFHCSEVGNNIHSKVLLQMVQELFAETGLAVSDLDAVAVGQGPGSFTGLRIGVGVGQGLAYGVGCPMIGVSSLDALALQSPLDGKVVAAIDARMNEVYWCDYQKQGTHIERLSALRVTPPSEVAIAQADALVGNAWREYQSQFESVDSIESIWQQDVIYPSAESLAALAILKYQNSETVPATDFAPIYVRDNVAKKKASSIAK